MSLELKKLSKTFYQGEREISVLKELNLKLERAQTLAILGPSGVGKSTLLALIAGLDAPDSGEIWVSETPVHQLSEKELAVFRARSVGFVFQQFHLISHLTALENVAFPQELAKNKTDWSYAESLLEKVGLKDRMSHLPSQLSGGECQRVAIARALVNRPSLVLADEPSGNLDSETGELVMGLFFEMVKQSEASLILVTHNHPLAMRCDRQLTLRQGHLE